MKKLIYLILLFLGACITKTNKVQITKENVLVASCERIILCDSLEYPSINFVISIKNTTDKMSYLFTNKLYKGSELVNGKYFNGGFLVEMNGIETPVGAYINTPIVKLKPKETIKLLLVYSELYPNDFGQSLGYEADDLKGLTKIAENISFKYQVDSTQIELFSKNNNGDNTVLIPEIIPIEMQTDSIEHNCNLTTEKIAEIVCGKVIYVDTVENNKYEEKLNNARYKR